MVTDIQRFWLNQIAVLSIGPCFDGKWLLIFVLEHFLQPLTVSFLCNCVSSCLNTEQKFLSSKIKNQDLKAIFEKTNHFIKILFYLFHSSNRSVPDQNPNFVRIISSSVFPRSAQMVWWWWRRWRLSEKEEIQLVVPLCSTSTSSS